MTLQATALGWQYYQAGDLIQAEALGRQALVADPNEPGALYLLATLAHVQGRVAESIPIYQRFLQVYPESAEAQNNLGVAYASLGRIEEALACYRNAVRLKPAYADALNNLGFLQGLQGDWDGAVDSYQRALAANPNHPDAWCNLGTAHFQQGRVDEAGRSFQRALALRPQYPNALNNLGNVLLAQDRPAEAADCYRQALRLRPNDAEAHNHLAIACMKLKQWEEALAWLRQSLACNPGNVKTHRHLGQLLSDLGRYAEAAAAYRQVVALCPDDREAAFLVEALSGTSTLPQMPRESLAEWYNEDRAAKWDRDPVQRLGYNSPDLLKAALGPAPPPRSLAVLDLGCGTGLCGLQFRDWAHTLIGVDLSPHMLARARARGIYEELILGDLLVPLQGESTFDLIVASDVVLLVGDLAPLMQAVHRALRPGGRFAFTVDLLEEPDGYRLLPWCHFGHSRAYLQKVTAATGLQELSAVPSVFPREGGQSAPGLVVILRRPS